MSDRPGEMDERDVDERFASIVAGWDGPLPSDALKDTAPAAPDDEGVEDTAEATTHASTPDAAEPTSDDPGAADAEETAEAADADPEPPAEQPRPPWVNPSPLDIIVPASSWRVPTAPSGPAGSSGSSTPSTSDPDDEHYEPPPVTLPPQEDLHFWGAVIGLVGGPLLLLYVALARPFHSERWFAAGVVLSLVGFGLLVLRQPRHRDPTDGDDGARV